jgi:hypothetical protein
MDEGSPGNRVLLAWIHGRGLIYASNFQVKFKFSEVKSQINWSEKSDKQHYIYKYPCPILNL